MPEIVVDFLRGTWRNAFRAKWRVDVPETTEIPLSRLGLALAPRRVRGTAARWRFERLISGSGVLRDWWLETCGGSGSERVRFLFRFPEPVASIPWELLASTPQRRNSRRLSFVRSLPGTPRPLPGKLDRKLSVLMVLGDENGGGGRLDLQGEARLIREAYDILPSGVRQAVAPPVLVQPSPSELAGLLAQHRPDVLWFSGHAEARPTRFWLRGGFLDPQGLEAALKDCGVVPAFALFWACETARPEGQFAAGAPPFYSALSRAGCLQVLAMQEVVSDQGAIRMAVEVFSALATGSALDVAAARAREAMRRAFDEGAGHELDWACPTVWGSGLTPALLDWSTPASHLARLQAGLARAERARRVTGGAIEANIVAKPAWADARRVWVVGNATGADRERWASEVAAFQREAPLFAVLVDVGEVGGDPATALARWAEAILSSLEPSDLPADGLREALEAIVFQPSAGWAMLCCLRGVLLAVVAPPPRAVAWFWDSLLGADAPVVILGPPAADYPPDEGWSLEVVGPEEDVMTASGTDGTLLAALALLRVPVPRDALGGSAVAARQLVSLGGRLVALSGSAARQVLGRLGPEQAGEAHVRCLQILNDECLHPRLSEPPLHEELLHHALGAGATNVALNEAAELLRLYRVADRPRAALAAFERVRHAWQEMNPRWLLHVAWAHVMVGQVEEGRFWLERAAPADALETAWWHGLTAEVHKASGEPGSKEAALNEIDMAIAVLRGRGPEETARARAYRQDRARILHYLMRRIAEARDEYEVLLDEWRGNPRGSVDRAYVARNLAGLLREGSAPGAPDWKRARLLLVSAGEEMFGRPDHPLGAEIRYEQARMALAEGDRPAARQLLGAAASAARLAGNGMVAAIADARIFWEFEQFDEGRWATLDARLRTFPRHGWAVRTSVNGDLRAARRLEVARPDLAVRLLRAAQEQLDRNPSFDEGSDRLRIAATAAGLLLLRAPEGPALWDAFQARVWAADWVASSGIDAPRGAWAAVG